MTNKHFTLTHLAVLAPSRLNLQFADGAEYQLDLTELIARHPVLAPLRDAKRFAQARLGEWGASVTWPDDDNLELAADNLRARAVEQLGQCSHEAIWNWMSRHNLTLDSAAAALGLSRRMVAYYRSGVKPVPRTVALACVGWETEQRMAA